MNAENITLFMGALAIAVSWWAVGVFLCICGERDDFRRRDYRAPIILFWPILLPIAAVCAVTDHLIDRFARKDEE